jgi:hypothetical protein
MFQQIGDEQDSDLAYYSGKKKPMMPELSTVSQISKPTRMCLEIELKKVTLLFSGYSYFWQLPRIQWL